MSVVPGSSLGPFRYCPLCAAPLSVTHAEPIPRRFCEPCGRVYYHNPVPAAGGVVRDGECVLLVRRKFPPRPGAWTLPAGFLEYFESPEACAEREVQEETGLSVKIDSLFGVYAGHDDPRQTAVLILYHMRTTGGVLTPGDDAIEAKFFPLSQCPEEIAFQAHRQALGDLRALDEAGPRGKDVNRCAG